MIQAFCSVYRKDYRAHEREPGIEKARPCLYYNDLVENFLPLEDSKAIYNPERDEVVIKEKHLKTLISTYQDSYCCNIFKKSLVIDPENLDDDQFMVHFNNYYAKRTQPVPRPLDTARRINGYTRFNYYYTGLSEYEDVIGRLAYDYFKRDYDRGKNRLFGKKQRAQRQGMKAETAEESPKEEPDPVEDRTPRAESSRDGRNSQEEKERICALCCEKFGDFTFKNEN